MGERYLLDCTLRDGGFINDWEFGYGTILNIFDRLCEAGIDFIEIGYLDDRRTFDINRTRQSSTQDLMRIFGNVNKHNSKITAMIDIGDCVIENVQNKSETNIDAIRLTFKKEKIEMAIDYAKQLKAKGYDVFLQMVSITSYNDRDLLDFIDKANSLKPFAVSIVDTYGLLHEKELVHYFDVLDRNLDNTIGMGYHAHNNFQLGYANVISFLERSCVRDLLVDGTLYGMGKSAGNDPIELVAMHLNNIYRKKYDLCNILEAIDNSIINIYSKKPWGYSYIYYIAAQNNCHHSYVTALMSKNTLSVKSVEEILSRIPKDNKLHFDSELLEQLYRKYQNNDIDDSKDISDLKEIIKGRPVFALGPGNTLHTYQTAIIDKIHKTNPVIISVNFIPDCDFDYIFFTNSKRYSLMYDRLDLFSDKIISTSNITPTSKSFKYRLNYSKLRDRFETSAPDNSLILLLSLLSSMDPLEIYLAGFDGFSNNNESDYYDKRMALHNYKQVDEHNQKIKESISVFKKNLNLIFITPSKYNE